MRKLISLLLVLLLIPVCAQAHVINLVENPAAEWAFAEGAPILEVVFPPVRGADACILRVGGEVMLVDAATIGQRARVAAALEQMGVERVNVGFNTHPHDDHIGGFTPVADAFGLEQLIVTFPDDANQRMKNTLSEMHTRDIPVRRAGNGDVLALGDAELTVIQMDAGWLTTNDRSAMLLVRFGERTLLLAADVELSAQNLLLKTCPEMLSADILKYPHHGVAKAGWNFLAHVGAQLGVVTNSRFSVNETRKDAKKRDLPLLYTAEDLIRLRTDGHIWVVDQWEIEAE